MLGDLRLDSDWFSCLTALLLMNQKYWLVQIFSMVCRRIISSQAPPPPALGAPLPPPPPWFRRPPRRHLLLPVARDPCPGHQIGDLRPHMPLHSRRARAVAEGPGSCHGHHALSDF